MREKGHCQGVSWACWVLLGWGQAGATVYVAATWGKEHKLPKVAVTMSVTMAGGSIKRGAAGTSVSCS